MQANFNNIKISIHQVNYSTVSSKWSKKSFPYPHHRLYYVTEGEAEIILLHKRITLKKGFLYLLPAHIMVESICKNSMSHYYIHFRIQLSLSYENLFEFNIPKIEVKSIDNNNTIRLFNTLKDNFQKSDLSSYLKAQGALFMLLAPFFEDIPSVDTKYERFYDVIYYINKNLSQDIQIEFLAQMINLNTVYFSNLFSKTFGMPPIQYINKKRIEYAQVLLHNTNKKVKDIAVEVGFPNNMYFSRLFHSKIGVPPGHYRKLSRESNQFKS